MKLFSVTISGRLRVNYPGQVHLWDTSKAEGAEVYTAPAKKKKRFKGTVFSLSTWALSAGATRKVTGHLLGAAGSLGVLFDPLDSFIQQQEQALWLLSLWKWVLGRDNNAEAPISGFSFRNFYSVAKSALISKNSPTLFSSVSVCTLTLKLHIYNFPTIRC